MRLLRRERGTHGKGLSDIFKKIQGYREKSEGEITKVEYVRISINETAELYE